MRKTLRLLATPLLLAAGAACTPQDPDAEPVPAPAPSPEPAPPPAPGPEPSPAPAPGQIGDLAAARRAWQARGPSSYAYTFSKVCFCVDRGDYAVEVRDGRVASVRNASTGESVGDRPISVPTVEQLFELIASAQQSGTPTRVSYHPGLGYPTEAEIGTLANDAGTQYHIRDLRPL